MENDIYYVDKRNGLFSKIADLVNAFEYRQTCDNSIVNYLLSLDSISRFLIVEVESQDYGLSLKELRDIPEFLDLQKRIEKVKSQIEAAMMCNPQTMVQLCPHCKKLITPE